MVVAAVFTAPVKKVLDVQDKEAEVAYDKQEHGESVNAFDRYVTGEHIPVTATRYVTGSTDKPIPTQQERAEMTTTERIKSGERVTHVARSNLNQRLVNKEAVTFEKQEKGEDLNLLDRIRAGERPTRAVKKTVTFNGNDPIPTPEERAEMSTFARIRSGESIKHVMKEKTPSIRSKVSKDDVPKDNE